MKRTIVSFLFLSFLIPLFAQNGEPYNKFDIRFGVVDNGNLLNYSGTKINFRVDFDYNLSKFISIGSYVGYAQLNESSYINSPTEEKIYGHGYYYGVNAYYHISPHFLNTDLNTKLDFYLKGKAGGISAKIEGGMFDAIEDDEYFTRFDYGFYLGASYYPIQRVGLNAEIGYGKNYVSKIGVTIRLGKLGE